MSSRALRNEADAILDNLVSFPASWLLVCKVLGWVWLFRVSIFADIRVGVFLLVQVTESMVNFAMF